MGYIASGKTEGANLVVGGDVDGPGHFVAPTVFDGVTNDMTIAKDEIFGPVLGVMAVKSAEDALEIATDTDYGLHATVFTRDIDRAISMARKLPCGTVSVNGFSEGDIKTPFGGLQAIRLAGSRQWHRSPRAIPTDQDHLDCDTKLGARGASRVTYTVLVPNIQPDIRGCHRCHP